MEKLFGRISLLLSILVVTSLLAGNALLAYRNVRNLAIDSERVTHTIEVMERLRGLDSDVQRYVDRHREYLDSDSAAALRGYRQLHVKIPGDLRSLQKLVADQRDQEELAAKLQVTFESLRDELDRLLVPADSAAPKILGESLRSGLLTTQLAEDVAKMLRRERQLLADRREEHVAAYAAAIWGIVVAAAFGVTVAICLLLLVHRYWRSRARAADTIAGQRELLQATLVGIGDGVIATNRHGAVTFMNPVAELLTGWSAADAAGQPISSICQMINGTTGLQLDNPARAVLANEAVNPSANHALLVDRDGATRPIDHSAAAIHTRDAQVNGAVLVLRDITGRYQQEQRVAEREARIGLLLDSTAEAICGIDLGGNCTFCNAAMLRLLGYDDSSELIGQPIQNGIRELIRGPGYGQNFDWRHSQQLETLPSLSQKTLFRRDGSSFAAELRTLPIIDSGKTVGAVVTFLDVSERERHATADRLRQQLTALRASSITVLARDLSREKALQSIADAFMRYLRAPAVRIWDLNDDESALRLLAATGNPNQIDWTEIPLEASFLGELARSGQPYGVDVVRPGDTVDALPWKPDDENLAFGAYPLMAGDRPVGLLAMYVPDALQTSLLTEVLPVTDALSHYLERKRHELQLRRSESLFRSLADSISQLAWMAEPDGNIFWYNRRWYEYTGTNSEEMEGWGWQQVHEPAMLPLILERWQASLQSGEPFDMTFPLRRSDGEFRPFLTRAVPVRDEHGKIVYWFGTNTDIQEQRQSEQALRASEQRFRQLADAMPQMIWVTRPDGYHEYFNRQWYDYTGCTPEECLGYNWVAPLHPDDVDRSGALWRDSLRTGRPYQVEYRFRSSKGLYRWFLGRALPVRNEAGEISRWYGTCTDIDDAKRGERSLKENEDRLRLAVELADLGMFDYHVQTGELALSDKARNILQLGDVTERTYSSFIMCVSPEDRDMVDRAIQDALDPDGSGQFAIEFRAIGHNQETRWVVSRGQTMFDDTSASRLAVRLIVTLLDLTERKRAQDELSASQSFLRSAIDALSSQLAVLNEQGEVLAVNDAWRRFAYEHELSTNHFAVGSNYLERGLPRMTDQSTQEPFDLAAQIRAVIAGDLPELTQEYSWRQGHENCWYQMRVTRFAGSGPSRVVVAHEDITDRVNSELATRRRSEQVQTLSAVATKLALATHVEPILHDVIRAAQRTIGVNTATISYIPTQSWFDSIHASAFSPAQDQWDAAQWVPDESSLFWQVSRDPQTVRLSESELRQHPVWSEWAASRSDAPPIRGLLAAPVTRLDGENIGMIQLTDREQGDFTGDDEAVLTQLAKMASVAIANALLYEQLLESDRRKDDFLAMLGHELRNPLAGIVSGVEALGALHLQGDAAEMQAVISRQAMHMSRLVDDLLDVSRIARGKLTLKRSAVCLNELMTNIVDDYRCSLLPPQMKLTVELTEQSVWVWGDRTRLTQVFSNLIHNACKFCDGPGTVRVSLNREPDTGEAVIRVIDSGIGMDSETLRQIFVPFSQADNSIERSRGGLGLGLALVRGLSALHGGSVSATSPGIGHGSTFVVTLPTITAPSQQAATSQPIAPKSYGVLLIDDRRDAILPIRTMLHNDGHKVSTAMDGPTGIDAARANQPEIILCDIGLTGTMNGYEVARALRQDADLRAVYLVAVTGYGQDDDRARARHAGFDFHLTKPVSLEQLRDLVARQPRFSEANDATA